MMLWIIYLLIMMTVVYCSYSVFLLLASAETENFKLKRIKTLLSGHRVGSEISVAQIVKAKINKWADQLVNEYVKKETKNSLKNDLYLAGKRSKHALTEFYVERVTLGLALLGAGVFLKLSTPAMFLAFFFGFMLPKLGLDKKREKRKKLIKQDFPLALDMIVISLEAGYNLNRALKLVIDDLQNISGKRHNIMVDEFKFLVNELQLGLDNEIAWNNLYRRTQVDEIKQFTAAVLQSEKLGSTLASTLRNLSMFIMKRRAQELESLAASIGAKMTLPLAVCILPVILAFVAGPFVIEIMSSKVF